VEHLQFICKHLLEKGDKQLFLFVNFLYYTFTRPNEEIWASPKIEHDKKRADSALAMP
jgi:hypothetical protein